MEQNSGVVVPPYVLVQDLMQLMADIPQDSIVSRTVQVDKHSKFVLFGFAAGQSLSEHTSAQPAMLYILRGQAEVTLGTDSHELGPGAWVHMPPNLAHSVYARTEVLMLLGLLGRQTT